MPKFNLRSWHEQTMYDCEDYTIEANTIEEAVALLAAAQDVADESKNGTAHHPNIMFLVGQAPAGTVRPVGVLDPHEIVAGGQGIVLIDDAGNKVGGDLYPDPVLIDKFTAEIKEQ